MKCGRKVMCKECPWQKDAPAGWLGSAEPWAFVKAIHSEEEMPCHKDINYEKKNWEKTLETDKVNYCVGQLLATKMACKRPRDQKHAAALDAVEPDENAMSSDEFLERHGNAPVKSWEL